jgi:hypothetical protein
MRYSPFHSNLKEFRDAQDDVMVKDILLSEIADAVVTRRDHVIDRLNRSGLYVDSSISTKDLSKIVSDNLSNKKFLQGLSTIIAMKTPADFESFASANGSKGTEKDYVLDIYSSVDGNIKSEDSNSLSDKTMKLLESLGLYNPNPARKGSGWFAFGTVALSATGIYFMAIKPLIKIKS